MPAIVIPWPPRVLHPNARPHWGRKAAAAKAYRSQCAWLAKAAGLSIAHDGCVPISIRFVPPDRRRRDWDGLLASIKAGLDGIADGLGIDDARFRPSIEVAPPEKVARVEVRIG